MKKFLACLLSCVMVFICANSLIACNLGGSSTNKDETYTVSFDAGRGKIFGNRFYEVEVEKNATVSAPSEEPVQEDYFFLGWNLTGDNDYAMWNFDTEKVTHDTTLHAVWVRGYTVTLDANGGAFADDSETCKLTVADGAKISAPNVTPPDDNHALKGWHNGYSYWDFATDTVSRDVTLTADWTFSDAVAAALAPFIYSDRYGSVTITGVKDKEATSLTVPSVVSYIADNAFKDCINLETVIIDDHVSSIGQSAFSGCAKLKNVTLPTGLKEIKEDTFDGCTSLEEIDIPDTLTSLEAGAFNGCSSLAAIELPAGVTKIQGSTFRGCSLLKEVKLGENITEIGAYAFTDCASLEEFEIPSGVKTIAGSLFKGCSALQSIIVPAACTEINSYAFHNSGLVTAEIHAKKVNLSAFEGCVSLVNLTIGSEVEEIGQGVFSGCTSLTEVEIPDSVTKTSGTVFKNCSNLKSVSIGTGLTEISSGMFSGCSSLRNVEFGGNISAIKSNAFADCISLLSFTIPSTVTSIDSKAFSGCARLVEIYNLSDVSIYKPISNTVIHTSASDASIIKTVNGLSFCTFNDLIYPYAEGWFLLDYTGDAENLVLPADYEGNNYKIFRYALSFNPQLKSVTISAGVEAIRDEILLGCDNVTSLTVDGGNTYYTSKNNCVIATADSKFVLGCKASVIPTDGSLKAIGSNVFCHNKTIVDDMFKIPASVTVIESDAFDGMDGIVRTAENGVQYVDNWAVGFDYHSAVYLDLEIEAGTVGIADRAFAANINTSGRWIKSVKTNAELKYIGEYAFTFCDFITEVTLNNGLSSIGGGAFSSCSRLEEIVIPDTVTYMGTSVFNYCSALKYVKLSSGLSIINNQMFSTCGALKSVVIPTSVAEIGQSVFWSQSNAVTVNPTLYYEGDKAQWDAIKKPNIGTDADKLQSLTKVYYSETAPTTGTAWHYDADGKPTTQY